MGPRATGAGGVVDRVGGQRRVARRGDRLDRRAAGVSGLRTGHPRLVGRAQRPGGVAGRGFPDDGRDAVVPGLRRADEAPRGHRVAPVRPGDGSVRRRPDGAAVRPDEHLFRGGCGGPAEGATGAFEGKAQRLPAVDAGPGARRQRVRAPLQGVRGQRRGIGDVARHARGAERAARRAGWSWIGASPPRTG